MQRGRRPSYQGKGTRAQGHKGKGKGKGKGGVHTTVSLLGKIQGEKIHSLSAHCVTSQHMACAPLHGAEALPYQSWLPHVLL